jgi:RNA polymerase sigma-70 factor, ECF subfamily
MIANDFNGLLLDNESNLEKFAYSLTLTKADAEDLVQETFLKALIYKDKYIIHENFKAWAFTIMRNTFINLYRRGKYKHSWHKENYESAFLNQINPVNPEDPDSAYSVAEMTHYIGQLKDPLRIPFEMHMNGYKYKEIANILGLNIGTIKSRIHLSRRKLMDQLNA